jgi:hypothetical protein
MPHLSPLGTQSEEPEHLTLHTGKTRCESFAMCLPCAEPVCPELWGAGGELPLMVFPGILARVQHVHSGDSYQRGHCVLSAAVSPSLLL